MATFKLKICGKEDELRLLELVETFNFKQQQQEIQRKKNLLTTFKVGKRKDKGYNLFPGSLEDNLVLIGIDR